jgi:hypothetical protein
LNNFEFVSHPARYSMQGLDQEVKNKNILLLSSVPDYYVRSSVKNNEEWVWNEYLSVAKVDNPYHYVNLCHMVVYGAKFSNRHEDIAKIRKLIE